MPWTCKTLQSRKIKPFGVRQGFNVDIRTAEVELKFQVVEDMVQRQAMQKPIWCSVLPWLCQHANLLTQTNLVKATSKPDITNLIPSSHNHSSCTLMTVYTVLGFSAIAVLNSVANNLSTVKRTWDWNNIFEIGWDNRVLGYCSHQVVSYALKTISVQLHTNSTWLTYLNPTTTETALNIIL